MDARFIVNHIKNEEQSGLDGLCTSARYFSAAAHQAESFPALNQKCLKRNYDEMESPFAGPGQQQQQERMPNDTCFPKSLPQQQQQQQQQQQPSPLLYRPPYSIPFHSSLQLGGPPDMSHLLVQEPKFPPQTFDIPDIQDLNSVFGGNNGAFDSPPSPFCGYPTAAHVPPQFLSDHQRPPYGSFYGSPDHHHHHHHSQFRSSLVVPPAFQTWQSSSSAASGGVVSSTGSTNSSPVSQAEEPMPPSVAEAASSASLQPQQVVQSAKNNNFAQSQSTISRLPNKKTRSPKRRKRKDPNEPQKPVSAYSLFFRNAQAAIKSQNPSATFGDVSKIVASMWDGLDDDVKNFYKRQMEIAKKEYLKQLAIYRATLVSQDVQGKTGPDGETGISTQHSAPPLPPAPPALPAQSPSSSSSSSSSQKVEDGVGLGLSPNPAPLCMSALGYPAQNPLSPAAEPVSHHLMSPQSSASHPQTFPLFYPDGPPCLPMRYSSPSDITAMRNSFLTYNQKLDQESVMSRMPEPNSYFHGIGPEAAGFKSGEYASPLAGNSFRNTLCREIQGRPFVDPDESDQKLT